MTAGTTLDRHPRLASDRLARILAALARPSDVPSTARLCEVCAEVVGVTGAGIMLMSADSPQGSLCSSNQVSGLIEELQYTLGEGPCLDAYRQDRVVIEEDLADARSSRWLGFTAPALEAGVRALYAFPLRVGTVRLGALNLYRDTPGPLGDQQHADALVMADVAARWILDTQAGVTDGALARELEDGADLRFVVHNAAGIVSVQLGVSMAEALLRLRARAFSDDLPLNSVAEAVVARKLRIT
jgi:GAF domain-containing protein